MIFFVIKALLGRWICDAEGGVKAGFSWLTAGPVHALLGALLAVSALAGWEWHEAARWHDFFLKQAKAFADAQAAADAREAAQMTRYTINAKEAQDHEQNDLAANAAAGDSYKRAHRLRPGAPGSSAGLPGAAGATVPADTSAQADLAGPSDPIVVSGRDFDTCTVDYTYAKAAYDWAKGLGAR